MVLEDPNFPCTFDCFDSWRIKKTKTKHLLLDCKVYPASSLQYLSFIKAMMFVCVSWTLVRYPTSAGVGNISPTLSISSATPQTSALRQMSATCPMLSTYLMSATSPMSTICPMRLKLFAVACLRHFHGQTANLTWYSDCPPPGECLRNVKLRAGG